MEQFWSRRRNVRPVLSSRAATTPPVSQRRAYVGLKCRLFCLLDRSRITTEVYAKLTFTPDVRDRCLPLGDTQNRPVGVTSKPAS
jgi:hypothetical protein